VEDRALTALVTVFQFLEYLSDRQAADAVRGRIDELPPVAERMQSPYDPQAHFSMKRQLSWTGYKAHVTETCDDDAAHLITHVKTCPSMQPDMTSKAEIQDRLAAKGLLPAAHFVDSAYVDAEL
jgi:transposase